MSDPVPAPAWPQVAIEDLPNGEVRAFTYCNGAIHFSTGARENLVVEDLKKRIKRLKSHSNIRIITVHDDTPMVTDSWRRASPDHEQY